MGRVLRFVLSGLAIIAIGTVLVSVFRLDLAERILLRQLADHGYPEARLEVSALSPWRATLRAVELTPERGPSAQRIELRYPVTALIRRDPGDMEAEIRRPRIRLQTDAATTTTRAEEPPGDDGRLARLLPLARLARIEISDGVIDFASEQAGPWSLDFDASVRGGPDGLETAVLDGRAQGGDPDLVLSVSARHEGDEIRARVGLMPADSGLESRFDLRLEPPWDDPRAHASHESVIDAGAGPAPRWWALPWPTAGTLRLSGEYTGGLGMNTIPRDLGGLIDGVIDGGWSGSWQVSGEDLGIDDRIGGVSIEAAGALGIDNGDIAVATDPTGAIRVDHLDPAEAERLPLPAELGRALFASPLQIEWPGTTVLRLRNDGGARASFHPELTVVRPDTDTQLRLAASTEWRARADLAVRTLDIELADLISEHADIEHLRINGDFTDSNAGTDGGTIELAARLSRLTLAPVAARDVEARMQLGLTADDEGSVRLRLGDDGHVAADGVTWPPALASASRLRARILGGEIVQGSEPRWFIELDVEPASWRADATAEGPIRIETGRHRLHLSGPSPLYPLARATLENLDARIDEPSLRAEGVDVDLRPGRIEGWLRFVVAGLHVEDGPLPLTPIRLHGRVDDWSDEGQRITGRGWMAGERAELELSGRLPAGGGDATLRIDWPDLAFAPGGLQPADLAPGLDVLKAVDGRVGAHVDLASNAVGLDGRAWVTSDALAFDLGPARVGGLDGTVALAGIQPWRSDGDQRLDAEHVALGTGVGVTRPRIRFAIAPRPGRGSVIEIHEAAGEAGGGRLYMPGWTFDPAAATHSFDIEAESVNLAAIVDGLAIPGLVATGNVTGRIPVTLVEDRVILRDLRFHGADGHIAFRTDDIEPGAPEAIRAFANLDYERLDVSLDQDLDRRDRIDIAARGRNPDVGGGATETYSLRLEGDLEPFITAILAGEPISRADLDRHLEAAP